MNHVHKIMITRLCAVQCI